MPPRHSRVPAWFQDADRLVHADGSEASEAEHRAHIAYAGLPAAGAGSAPSRQVLAGPALKSASLNHAMWFHRSARADRWLLYVLDSPSAQGGGMLAWGFDFQSFR